MKQRRKFGLSPWQILAIGYLVVILIGSVLLILPVATADGESTTYLNSLFTSVSATCVTGLVKYDTGVHWTLFGQIVILVLVQVGGLGFMSFVSVLFQMIGGKGMYSRNAFLTSMGANDLASIRTLLKRVFIGTFACEIIGAALLTIRFIPDYGVGNGIYFAIFHSITAFCNAGFDVMGIVGGASLATYCTDPLVVLVISFLIILGGLGFCVWGDVMDCRFHYKKFKLNTKVVLWTTLSLIVVPTILFMVFEWNNVSYVDYNFGNKLLASFFNAVTPRTAGFYTTDPATLSASGYLLTVILMFIGGASGSTAGGIKVGTIAVVIMGMLSVFKSNKEITMGRKRLDNSILSQALAIMTACLILVLLATMIICAVQPDLGFANVLFECVSGMGTVGLSTGITAELNACSTIIIMILMYFGRAGILTVVYALNRRKSDHNVKYPLDTLLIG